MILIYKRFSIHKIVSFFFLHLIIYTYRILRARNNNDQFPNNIWYIMHTCQCNEYPLIPNFYIQIQYNIQIILFSENGVNSGTPIFFIFGTKHRLWIFVRTRSRRACPCNIHRIISEASIENFNKKNRYTTANPCFFFYVKWSLRGYISRTCFLHEDQCFDQNIKNINIFRWNFWFL